MSTLFKRNLSLVALLAIIMLVAGCVGGGGQKQEFTVTVQVTPANGGAVTGVAQKYVKDAVTDITATANAGFQFVRWNGLSASLEQFATTNPLKVPVTANMSLTAVFEAVTNPDQEAAQVVQAQIAALPGVNAIVLADKPAVQAARAAYNALTAAQKALVTNYGVLEAAELRISQLEAEAADKAAAAEVDALIEALPAVANLALTDKAEVHAAKAAYDALTAAQQALVKTANRSKLEQAVARIAELEQSTEQAAKVEAQIAALPAVDALTLLDEEAVKEARRSYDALTAAQKALVTNVAKLVELENKLLDLRYEDITEEVVKERALLTDISRPVTTNLHLKTEFTHQSRLYSVNWVSSNPEVLSHTGQVNRPFDADANVTLTATVTYVGVVFQAPQVFTYPVVVKAYSLVDQYTLHLEILTPLAELIANGSTVMQIRAWLEGPNAAQFYGMLQFDSQQGLRAAQDFNAIDQGVAVFNVTLMEDINDVEDRIRVRVANHDAFGELGANELRNLETEWKNVTYLAEKTDDDPDTDSYFTYTVTRVTSMHLADRVRIVVGGVRPEHMNQVQDAIQTQVKLYNNRDQARPISIVGFDGPPVPAAGENAYAWTALIKLPDFAHVGFDPDGYNWYKADGTPDPALVNILIDNQYNYWTVERENRDAVKVRLHEDRDNHNPRQNLFMLIDPVVPEVRDVRAWHFEEPTFLPRNSLLVLFSEAVERDSAENPANYVLNGHRLRPQDVEYIRVLDIPGQGGGNQFNLLGYDAVKRGDERRTVIIQLTRRATLTYLETSNRNLLQVRSVADWAGVYDRSDNNKIDTQDFYFTYEKEVVAVNVGIELESPEQYVLTRILEDLSPVEDLHRHFTMAELEALLTVTLEMRTIGGTPRQTVYTVDDYLLTPVYKTWASHKAKYGVDYVILELTRDWTQLLEPQEPTAYHNKFFRVQIGGPGKPPVYDVLGNLLPQGVTVDVFVPEDTTSPWIETAWIQDRMGNLLPYLKHEYSQGTHKTTTTGRFQFLMNEPVQLFTNDGLLPHFEVVPARTPSVAQRVVGVPVPTFEYVKVSDGELYSAGQKVEGRIIFIETDHDELFRIEPTKALDNGDWKIVVRQISDDVGNTMSTEEIPFTFYTPDAPVVDPTFYVNPYIIWADVRDDFVHPQYGLGDYVFILYSRHMENEALRAATYHINGKRLTQDADITDQLINLWVFPQDYPVVAWRGDLVGNRIPQWQGHLVTIKLPTSFIIEDVSAQTTKPHVLTVPRHLMARNDSNVLTTEELQFGHNIIPNSNQFELPFDRNYGVTGIYPAAVVKEVPAITTAIGIERYQTIAKFRTFLYEGHIQVQSLNLLQHIPVLGLSSYELVLHLHNVPGGVVQLLGLPSGDVAVEAGPTYVQRPGYVEVRFPDFRVESTDTQLQILVWGPDGFIKSSRVLELDTFWP